MKNFFLVKLFRYIGSKFDGHKTKIAGIIPFCHATVSLIGLVFPDLQAQYGLSESTLEVIMGEYTVAFGLWGIGGKITKTQKALDSKNI